MGSGASSFPKEKCIVIVGAGYGGVALALELLKKGANFTIIDAKDAMHHNVASVRGAVQPGFAKKMVIPYEPTFGEHFRQGNVTRIDPEAKVVFLEGGQELPYDILVIATGSFGPMKECSGTAAQIIEKYSRIAQEVKESKKVVIIGGGPVGVEVAGEVATLYKDKSVTVVNNLPTLISMDAPVQFLKKLMHIVEQLHIQLVLDDTVENLDQLPDGMHGSYQLKTKNGKTIEADLVFKCIGLKVNNAAFASSLGRHLDEKGALKVNEFFQVEGFKDIFAFGDCCNAKEPKLAYVAKLQAEIVGTNVYNVLTSAPLKPWKSDMVKIYMGMSMGPNRGVFATKGGTVLPEFLIVNMKSSDLMVGRFFKEMHQPVPR